jgi:hypothetical protein
MLRTMMAGIALVALTLSAVAKETDAPADEYFGPFKYSALSARSKITSLGRSYRERWADDASIVHDAELVESALRAWAQKYPKDQWLAPTAFHLAQLYQEVQTQDARDHARATYRYLTTAFPSSKEAHQARLRLQQGFPPLHAETPVAPTPNPYASAAGSAAPSSSPGPASASTSPGAAASAAPASSAPAAAPPSSPRPTASASPKP